MVRLLWGVSVTSAVICTILSDWPIDAKAVSIVWMALATIWMIIALLQFKGSIKR